MTRDRNVLIATAALAVGAPLAAFAWIDASRSALADHLGSVGGVSVTLGTIDADLTGAIRLADVAFGTLVSADAIEASVALDSLLSGQLRADEIRIETPRVAIEIAADGDSDVARLARRLVRHGSSSRASGAPRLRRIVVSEGTLTARIAGVGELTAADVELVPDADGVRVITGALRMTTHGTATANTVDVGLTFSRSAAELALPQMKFRRALAVGGTGAITAGGRAIVLGDVAAGRLADQAMFDLRATVDDNGIARPVSVQVDPVARSLEVTGDHLPLGGFAVLAPHGFVLDDARASGTMHLTRAPELALAIDGSIDGLVVDHPALAAQPVPFAGAIHARLALTATSVEITELELKSGAIDLAVAGFLHRGNAATAGQLDATLATAACADLMASLPAELRGPLDGIVLAGDLGVQARLTVDLAAPVGDGAALTAQLVGECTALAEPPAADVTSLTGVTTQTMPDGTRARIGPGEPGWIDIARIPDRVRGAFVSAEDGRFWDHAGFDLQQIARSLEIDLREHRLARGGSTISQQLIKNAFLTHRRTLDRKIQEAVLTWRLEARLGKKQILERYLNIIELAPHVHGIGAAAQFWFNRTPAQLSTKQAAFLGAITSEPTSMSRRVRAHGGLDPVSAERVTTILRAMKRDNVISKAEYDAARLDGIDFTPSAVRDDR